MDKKEKKVIASAESAQAEDNIQTENTAEISQPQTGDEKSFDAGSRDKDAEFQALKLGAKGGTIQVARITAEGQRRRRLRVVADGADVRHIAAHSVQRVLHHCRLGGLVLLAGQSRPILIAGVHGGDNAVPCCSWAYLRVID